MVVSGGGGVEKERVEEARHASSFVYPRRSLQLLDPLTERGTGGVSFITRVLVQESPTRGRVAPGPP